MLMNGVLRPLALAAITATACCASIVVQASPDPPDCAAVPAGLVSWWPGEGNAKDVAGGADGELYRGVTFARGKVGQCFEFNGLNGGINVPDLPVLTLTGSLTIEAWLFVPRPPSAPGMVLFRGDTRSGLDPYYLSVEPRAGTSGMLGFVVWGEDNVNEAISAPMPIKQWTHVAATLQVDSCTARNGVMTLYTNGVVAAVTNTAVRPLGPLDPAFQPGLGIGNHSSQPGPFNYPFNGKIDELSLYGQALSAQEVEALYRAGSAGKCPLPPK
jgi:hypothetical protein